MMKPRKKHTHKKAAHKKMARKAEDKILEAVAATPDPNNPWMLAKKNGHRNKCECFNTNSVIPNLQTWTAVDNFPEQGKCERQLRHCRKF